MTVKKLVFAAALAVVCGATADEAIRKEVPAEIANETRAAKDARMAWWRNDRFGMFIHFGLYSMLGRHEWVRHRERITDADYRKYFERFDPDLFDAAEWAKAAKAAGMKYIVLTTKHHEGFCLFDSKFTDYKITKTPFGRDLVREFVDACRAEGLKVGFYYSLIDWHHPDFTIDYCHPLRAPDGFKGKEEEEFFAKANAGRDMGRYRKYMKDQIRELLTDYGKIDIVWFDFSYPDGKYAKGWRDWDSPGIIELTRKLQPGILIDNRLDLRDCDWGWDFITPEQFKVPEWPTYNGKRVPWETCQTFSGSWGYHRDEATWKSVPQLLELLTETVSKGGNLILNVGPDARGRFDRRAKNRLAAIGEWMEVNSRSVYGCTEAPEGFEAPNGTALTYNPARKRLYLHLYDYPMGYLPLRFWDKVTYAQFLHDGSEVKVVPPAKRHEQDGDASKRGFGGLVLPVVKPACEVPVVELWI